MQQQSPVSLWRRWSFELALALVLVFTCPANAAPPTSTVTLEFEVQVLDLDTGTVYGESDEAPATGSDLFIDHPEADLRVAYHADRALHPVVFHNVFSEVSVAFLDDTPFESVEDVSGLSFSASVVDEPFGPEDTVVVRTDTGSHYKLGRPAVDLTAGTVRFDYEKIGITVAASEVQDETTTVAVSATAEIPPEGLPASTWRRMIAHIREDAYRVWQAKDEDAIYVARNPRHHLRARFAPGGVLVEPVDRDSSWSWGLTLESWGRGDRLRLAGAVSPVAEGSRVEYRRGDLTEWYVNDAKGIEQGFTIARRPEGEGLLRVRLTTTGTLVPETEGDGLVLRDAGDRKRLGYRGLLAWDASGRDLAAHMSARDGMLTLEVDDAGAVYPVTIDPTIANEDAKLRATDAASRDEFGRTVSISGSTIVVGAPNDDDNGTNSGSAYVFVKPVDDGWTGALIEHAKLLPSDGASFDGFGSSASVSGDTVVVGAAADDDNGTSSGSVYVFVKPVGGWDGTLTEDAKLLASDGSGGEGPFRGGDFFGFSVAVSGDTVVVGANEDNDNGTASGSAYVFVKPVGGWYGTLNEEAKLLPSDGRFSDRFGGSVSASEGTIVVGGSSTDAAYVFVRPVGGWNGTLNEDARLLASNLSTLRDFGRSVSISGDTVVVGASGFGPPGSAYVFMKPVGGWNGTLSEDAKLVASDGDGSARFGIFVSVSTDTVVVGAAEDADGFIKPGAAYVFAKPTDGWNGILTEATKLLASDGAHIDRFGGAVSVSGGTVVVGARNHNDIVARSGSAYVFELNLGSCVIDIVPPEITASLEPTLLWPPNHRLVGIEATVTATDVCGSTTIELTSIYSSEPGNSAGDGDTNVDIKGANRGTADFDFALRAERVGDGNGRVYTVVYTATDASGNQASATSFVAVPHDQGGGVEPLSLSVRDEGSGTLIEWTEVSGAIFYNVISGQITNFLDTSLNFDLGATACIEAASFDTSTVGHEHAGQPAPGEAIFYLVEYFDGWSSGFSTESAARPRSMTGGCASQGG